jgi:hypothetical protein
MTLLAIASSTLSDMLIANEDRGSKRDPYFRSRYQSQTREENDRLGAVLTLILCTLLTIIYNKQSIHVIINPNLTSIH